VADVFDRVLAATHLSRPSDVGTVLVREAAGLGAADVVLYLPDYAQEVLVPLPADGSPERSIQQVDGTMVGRAYASTTILQSPTAGRAGRIRVWLPLLDGTDRVGAMELTLPGTGEVPFEELAAWERFAHLASQVLVVKSVYGDDLERIRRRLPMSIAGELIWRLLPPLTFATDDLVISGLVEPAYEIGGDAFDYAVNSSVAYIAVFDAMGHGLAAAGLTSFALSAYRNTRVRGASLGEAYLTMHQAISETFGGERYATALLLELDLASGRLRWLNAGHPEPLLIRGGKVVKTLSTVPCLPLGLPFEASHPQEATESLEPGDQILLYTDGFPEARMPDGELFGLDRLIEFIEREVAAEQSAPETLRRLRRTLLVGQDSQLRDDATAVLVAWRTGGERAVLPPTVP
jgi:serine/threonine protein phosphatase PrpC